MKPSRASSTRHLRRKPLAACLGALLALSTTSALATNWPVTSCADNGAGTLRAVVGASTTMSGDVVDMSALTTCVGSKITLTTGAIEIDQTALTLHGPGAAALRITAAANTDGVLYFAGFGTLTVDNMTIADASPLPDQVGNVVGGCIYASGSLSLVDATVSGCKAVTNATSGTARAEGGGVVVAGDLTMLRSTISGNLVAANGTGTAFGGGAALFGYLTMTDSSISDNHVTLGQAPFTRATGGGVYLQSALGSGKIHISGSTISGNSSAYLSGGLHLQCLSQSYANACLATISNSTISGNSAVRAGGLYSTFPTTLNNSTIADNTASAGKNASPGATFGAFNLPTAVKLQSTLLANNAFVPAASPASNDLQTLAISGGSAVSVTAVNSLIRTPGAGLSFGAGNLTAVCPLLGPLRNNGGPTQTLALLSHSPGLDAGANPTGLAFDQRGMPYARVAGSTADIGAYELDPAEIVFASSFDGCP